VFVDKPCGDKKKAVRFCIADMLMRASKAVTLVDQDLEAATVRAGERQDSLPGPTFPWGKDPMRVFSTI